MSTGDLILRGNPGTDYHPIEGGGGGGSRITPSRFMHKKLRQASAS